jgi:hypothetical protein
VAQYWNDLKGLPEQVEKHQRSQEECVAKVLRIEWERRTLVEEEEIAAEVTQIWTDMQEFVIKQLQDWIQEGVKVRLQSLPLAIPALKIQQIQGVVRREQPKDNSFLQRTQQDRREKQIQKERKDFIGLIKEQWAEVEKDMEKRLKEKYPTQRTSP